MLSTRHPLSRNPCLLSTLALLTVLAGTVFAATATAAITVKLPDRAAVTGRTLVLPVKNPGSTAVRGKIDLKQGRQRLGPVTFHIGAKAQQRVRIKLPRNLAGRIAKQGRAKLRLVVKVRTDGGRGRTIRRSLIAVRKPRSGGGRGGARVSPFDGTYRESNGWTMAVEDGVVKGFSGSISTYCTVSGRQKNVYFAMIGDDPFPTVAQDGSYSWEATRGYGFVKLKFEGRIVKGVARGKMMVEDRSMILGSGRIEFDYCFAGREYKLTRDAGGSRVSAAPKVGGPPAASSSTAKARTGKKKGAGSGWRIAKVNLDGWSQHSLIESGDNFGAEGRVRYRTQGRLTGGRARLQPRRPRLAEPLTAQGIRWSSATEARLSTPHGSWNCSHHQPWIKADLAGAFTVLARKVRVQWSLSPTMLRCPAGAPKWSFPGLPIKAMTSTFPRRLLKRRTARIPVDIQHRWRDEAGRHEVHWDGTVTLQRG